MLGSLAQAKAKQASKPSSKAEQRITGYAIGERGTHKQQVQSATHLGNEPPTSALLNDRAVTLIIYLNDAAEWGPNGIDGGGELRIHQTAQQCDDEALFGSGWQGGRDGGGAAGPYVDVMPLAGRVALFRSELLHEVLPTCDGRLRLALSMWCVRLPV